MCWHFSLHLMLSQKYEKYFEKKNLSIYTAGICQLYRDLKSTNLQKCHSRRFNICKIKANGDNELESEYLFEFSQFVLWINFFGT